MSDADLAKVTALAKMQVPPERPATPEQFSKFMRSISTLPRRADGDITAEERVQIYQRRLGAASREALGFLTAEALDKSKFMPSVAECLEILSRWKRKDEAMEAHNLAKSLSRTERQARFDALMKRLEARIVPQAEIDTLPEAIAEIAEARMFLIRTGPGKYEPRPIRPMPKQDPEEPFSLT